MEYTSTRDASLRYQSAQCFLRGISPEGGLFVPTEFPQISTGEIAAMANMSYAGRAYTVLSRYLTDFSQEDLKTCISGAYGQQFDSPDKAPLHRLDDKTYILELFHGPTLAFKDMALQMLPRFLSFARKMEGVRDEILILVATSGDTGKAALEGFCDVEGMRIAVFFPNDGVSRMQQLQMLTQEGSNVFVCAVNGNFDDAQTGVKKIFGDDEIARLMAEKGIRLSSANSINWGRLCPQIVYYFSAYADLIKQGRIRAGENVNFTVPTGNFGDILAGYYAKRMGLPLGRLLCASNCNNVLTDFFTSGTYNANRTFHKTTSPSMDILISSNLERLLFELSGRDDALVRQLMVQLKETGQYSIPPKMQQRMASHFAAGYADEKATRAAISSAWEKYGYCMDTHTAVAFSVEQAYANRSGDSAVNVVLSTASPYKFPRAVLTAIRGSAPEDDFEAAAALSALGVPMPRQIRELESKPVLHHAVCEKQDMAEAILKHIGEKENE